MVMKAKHIAYETLHADEVEMLPPRVRARLGEAAEAGAGDEWVVIHLSSPLGDMVDQLGRLDKVIEAWAERARLDGELARLVDTASGVEATLALDNLTLRRQYLDDTPTLTAEEIHRISGLHSRNKSEPASRWKNEGKTLAVRVGRRDLYPAFQFEDGAPRPVMRDVLAALPERMTGWQKALWFASGNGWLDGDEPQRRLNDREQLVDAARRLSEPADG